MARKPPAGKRITSTAAEKTCTAERGCSALSSMRGSFVAFGSSADAKREAAAFYERSGRFINLLTVQEILDDECVQKI